MIMLEGGEPLGEGEEGLLLGTGSILREDPARIRALDEEDDQTFLPKVFKEKVASQMLGMTWLLSVEPGVKTRWPHEPDDALASSLRPTSLDEKSSTIRSRSLSKAFLDVSWQGFQISQEGRLKGSSTNWGKASSGSTAETWSKFPKARQAI